MMRANMYKLLLYCVVIVLAENRKKHFLLTQFLFLIYVSIVQLPSLHAGHPRYNIIIKDKCNKHNILC